jgi:Macrocin-O-methyltransferase (TylF)
MPEFERAWDYENGFYLTSQPSRLGKVLAHAELFRMVAGLTGAVVECGVFRGASLVRWATFRHLFAADAAVEIVGFDTFATFPETGHQPDHAPRDRFLREAGDASIGRDQLEAVLAHKGLGERVTLVAGDIVETVPEYVAAHPELRIALLNVDVDVYEPTVVALRELWPRVVPGGILVLDDYGVFPGETKAADELLPGCELQRFPWASTPTWVAKPPVS